MARPRSDYEEWQKSIDDINAEGKINHGLWTPFTGPPFMQAIFFKTLLYSDVYEGNLLGR